MRMSMMSVPSGDLRRFWLRTRTNSGLAIDLVVGADQHRRDRPLHVDRGGGGEEARELVQALAVAQAMPGERFESANLRARSGHARDAGRDETQLLDVGDRPVTRGRPARARRPHRKGS